MNNYFQLKDDTDSRPLKMLNNKDFFTAPVLKKLLAPLQRTYWVGGGGGGWAEVYTEVKYIHA